MITAKSDLIITSKGSASAQHGGGLRAYTTVEREGAQYEVYVGIDQPAIAVYLLAKLSGGEEYQREGVNFRLSSVSITLGGADVEQHRIWAGNGRRNLIEDVSFVPSAIAGQSEIRNNLVLAEDPDVTYKNIPAHHQEMARKYASFIEIANDTLERVRDAAVKMQRFTGSVLEELSSSGRGVTRE